MSLKSGLGKVFDATVGGLASLAGVLLVYLMLSVTLEVVMRYFLNRPQQWVGELAEYALLYITFTGTAWVLKRGTHVRIDVLNPFLRPGTIKVLGLVSDMIGLFVCAVLTYYGVKVTADHFARGVYNPTLMEFPKGPLMAVIPVGTFLMSVQLIRRIVAFFAEPRARV